MKNDSLYSCTEAELKDIGVPRSTVRLALGYINSADEVIKDLEQALARIGSTLSVVE